MAIQNTPKLKCLFVKTTQACYINKWNKQSMPNIITGIWTSYQITILKDCNQTGIGKHAEKCSDTWIVFWC